MSFAQCELARKQWIKPRSSRLRSDDTSMTGSVMTPPPFGEEVLRGLADAARAQRRAAGGRLRAASLLVVAIPAKTSWRAHSWARFAPCQYFRSCEISDTGTALILGGRGLGCG